MLEYIYNADLPLPEVFLILIVLAAFVFFLVYRLDEEGVAIDLTGHENISGHCPGCHHYGALGMTKVVIFIAGMAMIFSLGLR